MKRKIRLSLMAALAVAILTTTAAAATGSSNLYDTANDPIVTYSGMQKWAEETFRPSINRTITNTVAPLQTALNEAEQKLSQAQQTIAELEKTIAALAQKVDNINVSAESGGFEVIYVTAGDPGACHFGMQSHPARRYGNRGLSLHRNQRTGHFRPDNRRRATGRGIDTCQPLHHHPPRKRRTRHQSHFRRRSLHFSTARGLFACRVIKANTTGQNEKNCYSASAPLSLWC